MRTLTLSTVVLALLGAASVVMAQSDNEAAVVQAVKALRNTMVKADRAQFEALTTISSATAIRPGRVEDKALFINAATSGQSRWKFITLTDQTIQLVGDNTIVRHTLTVKTEHDGKTYPQGRGIPMCSLVIQLSSVSS